jgi:hypothetical protein
MPVTAKLSSKFEKFDDITNELVDWLNKVDATYRTELRELNELNFARFEAKLEQKLAELRTEIRTGAADLRTEMQGGLAKFEGSLARLEGSLARLEGGLLARIAMAAGRLARLTVGLWVATLATVTALLKL